MQPNPWVLLRPALALGIALSAAATRVPAGELDAVPAPPASPPAVAAPRVGGYLQARSVAQADVGLTSTLNRARFSIEGVLPARFAYRLLIELEASAGARSPSTPSLREAYVRWTRAPFTVTAGQMKTPFTREYLIPVTALETPDLSVAVDTLAPKYDIGVMGEYAVGTWATLSLGAFNGEGQNASANRDSTALWVARATVVPLAALGLGASVTQEGSDSLRWGMDASFEHRGALVRADWLTRHRHGRARDRDDTGWSVLAGYRATPRVQLIGRLEEVARPWTRPGRRVRGTDFGVNLDLVPNRVRLMVHGIRRTTGTPRRGTDTALAQLQARF